MKLSSFLTLLLGSIIITLATTSCESDPINPIKDGTTPAKVGGGFLSTDYQPLDQWFSERFEVKYRNLSPEMIFDQVPINSIHYNTSNLPVNAPLFNLESDNISRREILKKVAAFWNLKMSIQNGPDGKPSSVNVVGRG